MRTRTLFLSLAVLALTSTIAAQDKAAQLDKVFEWATPDTPGCAVAVSLKGKIVADRAYGSADLERDVPLRPDSIFDAGSLTKQFVAAAVLLLVEDGKLSLSDDVRKHITELPDYGAKVTIDHLLTHTSGVRDWTGMLPLAAGEPDALRLVLRQRALDFAPGSEWAYSNSGYVLLKEVVSRVSGMTFAQFAQKRLFEPAGMKSTAYSTDLREIVKNRALAYDREGNRWRSSMLLDNDRGGGGALLTTTRDLLAWNDALTSDRIGTSVSRKLEEPARLSNGRVLSYGRGLFLDTEQTPKVLWHSGSAAGYKALAGRFPEHGLSVAILCNSGDGTDRIAAARRIFDIFLPGARKVENRAADPASNSTDHAARAGLFFNEASGQPLQLAFDRGVLRISGGVPLRAIDAGRFKPVERSLGSMSDDDFELRFLSADQFEVKTMEGATTRYRRAAGWAPDASALKSFAGRYVSEEIGSVFEIVPVASGLTLRLEHDPSTVLPLRPVDRDTFQVARMLVRFVRDERGKVTGLDYSNPLLRKVRFMRAAEHSQGNEWGTPRADPFASAASGCRANCLRLTFITQSRREAVAVGRRRPTLRAVEARSAFQRCER